MRVKCCGQVYVRQLTGIAGLKSGPDGLPESAFWRFRGQTLPLGARPLGLYGVWAPDARGVLLGDSEPTPVGVCTRTPSCHSPSVPLLDDASSPSSSSSSASTPHDSGAAQAAPVELEAEYGGIAGAEVLLPSEWLDIGAVFFRDGDTGSIRSVNPPPLVLNGSLNMPEAGVMP